MPFGSYLRHKGCTKAVDSELNKRGQQRAGRYSTRAAANSAEGRQLLRGALGSTKQIAEKQFQVVDQTRQKARLFHRLQGHNRGIHQQLTIQLYG